MKERAAVLVCLLGLLQFAVGCSRQFSSGEAQAATGEGDLLPFGQLPTHQGIEPSKSFLPRIVSLPEGTVISVRLQNGLSSATTRTGDTFDAVLDDPIVVDRRTIAGRGAAVRGRVTAARSSGRLHNSGYLRVTLTSVEIEGTPVPVQTSSVSSAGGSHRDRDLALIGGGAGAGTLIGALAGGGKGALIGGLVGAGAGTATAYATGQKDVSFAAERRLSFRLIQPANI